MFVTALETQMSTLETSKGREALQGGLLQLLLHLIPCLMLYVCIVFLQCQLDFVLLFLRRCFTL